MSESVIRARHACGSMMTFDSLRPKKICAWPVVVGRRVTNAPQFEVGTERQVNEESRRAPTMMSAGKEFASLEPAIEIAACRFACVPISSLHCDDFSHHVK